MQHDRLGRTGSKGRVHHWQATQTENLFRGKFFMSFSSSDIRQDICRFLSRDYVADQVRLNKALAKKSCQGAGLAADMPPIPFTGSPFTLRPGNCIALIGLNPRWNGWASKHAPIEYLPLKRSTDVIRTGHLGEIENYIGLRASYFKDDSVMYYGRYFNRLGNRINGAWRLLADTDFLRANDARRLFQRYIFKTDVIPYFSNNTSYIDTRRLADAQKTDAALVKYQSMTFGLLSYLKPRWIQVNGLQMEQFIRSFLDIQFTEIKLAASGRILCGWVDLKNGSSAIPVLVHGFVGSRGGPQSDLSFGEVARSFEEFVGEPSRFTLGMNGSSS